MSTIFKVVDFVNYVFILLVMLEVLKSRYLRIAVT